MSLMRLPRTILGEWVSGTTIVALIIATCGCNGISPNNPGEAYGVLVNTDTSKDLIGGVRMRNGQSTYAFGTFNPDGSVGEVTAVRFENEHGQKATLYFESGRPVRGIGFDGSELLIRYDEVSALFLRGHVTLNLASGETYEWDFDIDVQLTAAQIDATIEELTGIDITSDAPPEQPNLSDPGDKSLRTAKAGRNDSGIVLVVVVPILIAVSGFTIHLVTGQILENFVRTADAIAEAAVLAFLTPFIIMGNIMRLALGQPLVTISYDQGDPVLNIPRPD